MIVTVVLLWAMVVIAACSKTARGPARSDPLAFIVADAPANLRPPVVGVDIAVLVVLDGVRAREVFEGVDRERALRDGEDPHETQSAPELMPHLHRLLATRGAAIGAPGGAGIVASGPEYLSLPGYVEILTGMRDGGCRDNHCEKIEHRTLAHDFLGEEESGPGAVAAFASWGPLARALGNASGILVSAGRGGTNHPELLRAGPALRALFRRGERADPWPGFGSYRPDRSTAALAVEYLRTQRPRFLFLSLGDPDEYAHRGDYHGYLASLRRADRTIGQIAQLLESRARGGARTLLLITTDHGRSDDFVEHGGAHPESAQSWLIAAGDAIAARGHLQGRHVHLLADVAPTVRAAAGLVDPDPHPSDGSAITELFRPPPPALIVDAAARR